LAKALVTLQKTEPNLPPVEMLAKAEGIAQEKQAASNKASALSVAKANILKGKAPTPAQQAYIDSLTPEEAAAWNQSVEDAKTAGQSQALESLLAKLEAQAAAGIKPTAESAPEWAILTGEQYAAAQQAALDKQKIWETQTKQELLDAIKTKVDFGESLAFSPDEIAKLKQLPTADADDVFKTVNTQVLQKSLDQEVLSVMKGTKKAEDVLAGLEKIALSDPIPENQAIAKQAISDVIVWSNNAKAKEELEAMAKQPGITGKVADSFVKSKLAGFSTDSWPSLLDDAKGTIDIESKTEIINVAINGANVTKQKQAAFKSLTGIDPVKDPILAKDYLNVFDYTTGESASFLDKIEVVAAEKQAAANLASNLSKAKKKLAQGKEPSPSEKAAIASLDPAALATFNQQVSDSWLANLFNAPAPQQPAAPTAKVQAADGSTAAGKKQIQEKASEMLSGILSKTIPTKAGTEDIFRTFNNAKTGNVNWVEDSDGIPKAAVAWEDSPQGIKISLLASEDENLANLATVLIEPVQAAVNSGKGISFTTSNEHMKTMAKAIGLKEKQTGNASISGFAIYDDETGAFLANLKLAANQGAQGAAAPLPGAAPISQQAPAAATTVQINATTATATQPDVDVKNLDLYVPDPAGLKIIKTLSGSTRPTLREDTTTGKLWVVKSPDQGGGGPEHLRSEATADQLYRIMGASVPGSKYIETGGQSYKVAEYLEGAETLGSWESGKTQKQKQEVYEQLREHFVVDALLGNWDVAGQTNDNVMVTKDGRAVRIDNGGSLTFRAQGTKKTADQFAPEVNELKTLRDSATSAGQTAEIFKGISDSEIHDQIERVIEKRDELLEATRAAEGDAVAKQLEARINWLETQLPANRRTKAKAARKAASRAVDTGERDFSKIAKAVEKARINGYALPAGTTDIEDMQTLVWQERTTTGEFETVVHLKVTDVGAAKIRAAIPSSVKQSSPNTSTATTAGPSIHPQDNDYQPAALATAKTLATHIGDKAYNAGTIATFNLKKSEIDASLIAEKKTNNDPGKVAMLEYYAEIYENLADALIKQIAPPVVPNSSWAYDASKWSAKTKKPATPAAQGLITGTRSKNYNARETTFKNGFATQTGGVAFSTKTDSDVFVLTFTDDGSKIQIVDRKASDRERAGLALEGQVEVRVNGEATPENIKKALEKLEQIGIDTKQADDDYKEWVWLIKTANVRNETNRAEWLGIANLPDVKDRIVAGRNFIETKYNVKVPKRGEEGYTADGVANIYGDGTKHVYRADLTRKTVEKEMADYGLFHSTSRPIAEVINALLQSGGEATPTIDRMRKGVNVGLTGGKSAKDDVESGGASFFFTRIRKKNNVDNGLVFKIGNLARADAITYDSDRWGRLQDKGDRQSTIVEYKKNAQKSGSDETIFKRGLFLLEEIDFIKLGVYSSSRKEVLDAFKKNGIDKLPDGRRVEDIIIQ
jgi:hypothetical protein